MFCKMGILDSIYLRYPVYQVRQKQLKENKRPVSQLVYVGLVLLWLVKLFSFIYAQNLLKDLLNHLIAVEA